MCKEKKLHEQFPNIVGIADMVESAFGYKEL